MNPTIIHPPIRLGLIGAGIFMRDAHLPSLQRLSHRYHIVAICSKGGASARRLAETLPYPVSIYTDPAELLANPEIDAVDIVLPIDVLPEVIEMALRAGKHVVSEKPIAGDTATGARLIEVYRGMQPHPSPPRLGREPIGGQKEDPSSVLDQPPPSFGEGWGGVAWMVAENWRYEAAFAKVKSIIDSGEIGRPLTFHWAQHIAMTAANKYFHTAWRRTGHIPGGLLLDVGVHHVAALRLIFGEVASVTADVEQFSPDLPPVDTLAATIRMESGVVGSYLVSFAAGAAWQPILHIVGEQGSLRVQRGFLEVTTAGTTRPIEVAGMNGVEKELEAFAITLTTGKPHKNPPEAAQRDLLTIEAMLHSSATGQRVVLE